MVVDDRNHAERAGPALLKLAAWAEILAPFGILLHELGHFVAGSLLGYTVRLGAAIVSGGPTLGSAPGWSVAVQAFAGPLVTIALMIVAAAGLLRRPMPNWAFALAITAPLRFLAGASYMFWVSRAWLQGQTLAGSPNFDEDNAAVGLGLSPARSLVVQIIA